MTQSPLYPHFKLWMPADWRWPHFTAAELACKGDGSVMLDTVALDRLEALRVYLATPFVVFSAYRSPAYNAHVGGAPHSQHMQGRAFDISMRGHDPHEFEAAARAFGFHGIGNYPGKGFMHIDTRPEPAAWTIPPGARWPIYEDEAPHPAPARHLDLVPQIAQVAGDVVQVSGVLAEAIHAVQNLIHPGPVPEASTGPDRVKRRIGGKWVNQVR